jgi:hypothetical protein
MSLEQSVSLSSLPFAVMRTASVLKAEWWIEMHFDVGTLERGRELALVVASIQRALRTFVVGCCHASTECAREPPEATGC